MKSAKADFICSWISGRQPLGKSIRSGYRRAHGVPLLIASTQKMLFGILLSREIPLPSPPSASPSIFLRAVSLTNGSGRAAL